MNVQELRENFEIIVLEAQEELNELQAMIYIDDVIKAIHKEVFDSK